MTQQLKRILYAEDEEDIREIVNISLGDIGGFELKSCASGEELLQAYASFEPDLILLDVMMPGLDGIATFKRLREMPAYQDTPVVFMTAKVQVSEVQSYKKMGALEVISKPFNPMNLADRVQTIWSSR